VQPHRGQALRACLKAGFRYATSSASEAPVLILTAPEAHKRYNA